jgi:hypothetical protein
VRWFNLVYVCTIPEQTDGYGYQVVVAGDGDGVWSKHALLFLFSYLFILVSPFISGFFFFFFYVTLCTMEG